MPKLGTSKRSNRECLVCGTTTKTAHMGVDVCRACTVFYRRASGTKKPYACRAGTKGCVAGKGLNCKKCRLHHIDHILEKSGAKDQLITIPEEKTVSFQPMVEITQSSEIRMNSSIIPISNVFLNCGDDMCAQPVLWRVKTAYE
ncbi:hypothetical protein PENTCL1PPCAC_15592 [Pristionchus entomophagus]|uniref:Nuclear receptor domain-containing protein n=1 Tax=Pristionchus entomophagus TaxID=358040 RepID=A0AAV5TCY6_9BILA|nr:hypothetical protein PENTCL1PPCAC_15592 [Pristionchus entomophagus]